MGTHVQAVGITRDVELDGFQHAQRRAITRNIELRRVFPAAFSNNRAAKITALGVEAESVSFNGQRVVRRFQDTLE